MKLIPYILVTLIAVLPLGAQAAPPPPYLSVIEAENIDFSDSSCTTAASSVLKADGFSRVTVKGNIIFGAFHSGRDYRFKVAMKCLNHHQLVTITVVSASSGGLAKARSLVAQLKAYTAPKSDWEDTQDEAEESDDVDDADMDNEKVSLSAVDCSSGNNLVRCLDSIPANSIKIAQQYLGKRLQ